MEAIVYYSLCLLGRKNIFVHVSYLLGTLAFITFSYQSANKLYEIPTGVSVFVPEPSIHINRTLNKSLQYERRTEFLRNKCSDNGKLLISTPSIAKDHTNLINHLGFLLRSHSLFYCSVPKVATRTLLNYITYLHIQNELITSLTNNSSVYFKNTSNLFDVDYLNQILSSSIKNDSLLLLSRLLATIKSNASQLDLWEIYQKTALPYVRLRTLSDSSILFSSSYTRVIFVRHPLERLASAYTDKIGSLKAVPLTLYDSLRRNICRKYATSYLTPAEQHAYRIKRFLKKDIHEPCAKVIPSFEHFVEHIMSDSSQVDVHWQPYSTLCGACTLNYNFIGKYETLQEDFNALKLKLGLNSTDWNIDNHFSNGKTKENYKLMYSKLSNHLICNLKNFYSEDLQLFDYRFEDYLMDHQRTNCSAQFYRRFNAFAF